jgi:hypothetical protein
MFARITTIACVCGLLTTGVVATEPVPAPATRSLTAIRTDVSDALRAEATTRRTGDNTPQVMRLVDLYLEMAAHPRRDTSPLLADLGQQVRLRLQTVRERVERRIPEKNLVAKKTPKPGARGATVAEKAESRVLAQQVAPGGAAGNQRNLGGQGAALAVASNVAARPTDFGPELVELIEAVISPATWRINGGNGAIVYYSPLHVLVVSAPDDVHAQVGGVLQQLQAAQRRQDGAQVVAEVGAVRAAEAQ